MQTGHSGYSEQVATAAGVEAALSPVLGLATLGKHVGAVVDDLSSGQVLLSRNASSGFAPASTAKLAVAVAALDVLGPAATFTTRVVAGSSASSIVLVGGGDPTLAAGHPPASNYPQSAALASLAGQTARELRARGVRAVRLGYDTSLFTGPVLAPGWPRSYVTTGNVTPISSLEVDQGRLTASGAPQDANDGENFRPRTFAPAAEAAQSFAGFLAGDGIRVRGVVTQTAAPHGAASIAAVKSPPLAEIVYWMLSQSNNVIAENLARQVAIATGRPASFSGAAAAETAVLRKLGVGGMIRLVDGSGLSPRDRIAPNAEVQLIRLAAAEPARPAGRHHRPAGGGVLRHAGPGRQRLPRRGPGRARRGAGQDRKPVDRGVAGRDRGGQGRSAVRVRVHGRPAEQQRPGRRGVRSDQARYGPGGLRLRLSARPGASHPAGQRTVGG